MAIEIIPKREKRWFLVNVLFYLSLGLLLVCFLLYLIFNHLENKNSANLENLNSQIASMKTEERRNTEQELLAYKKKIDIFSQLLKAHKYPVAFFDYLQTLCHPEVYFQDFSLDIKGSKVTISGIAESFPSLAQQVLIFKNAEFIEDVNLSNIGIEEEGNKAMFSISFSLSPKILEFQELESKIETGSETETAPETETETETETEVEA